MGKPLRVGLVGFGFGYFHARTIAGRPDATLVAVADRSNDGLADAADAFGFEVYRDAVEMVRSGKIDAVVNDITAAFNKQPDLPNLLMADQFKDEVAGRQEAWRRVVRLAQVQGVPVPGFSTSLAYYDSYRTARLPANLIQAQRDYFGAHTYERVDKEVGETFHTEWSPDQPAKDPGGASSDSEPAQERIAASYEGD